MTRAELEKQNYELIKALAKANKALITFKKHILWDRGGLISDCQDLTPYEADTIKRVVHLENYQR